ncbi:hypothetical protein SAMN02745165_01449 [Malonomonas rubra DSM 5091]|uniref:Uncharacterized protein n=1 Tax=Malonomonas rubra DSM 5091 TaxID=1122189 RepID=A0A1M6G8P7_MALRU|nr:hypothetical protein [Malonomonas rubra]SHJ06197.1 hypothetical protein SAMN02745165_01449 [Malonomonas rubra DSM 5091]
MSKYQKSNNNRSKTINGRQIWERACTRNMRTHNNLCALATFLIVSIIAFQFKDFNLFTSVSEPVRELLGYPPAPYLVSIALAVYGFSATVLTLTSIANEHAPASSWKHLGYRAAFFLFYSFSGSIAAHFVPVVLVGLSLYALDQLHIWFYNAKAVQEQKELLGRF